MGTFSALLALCAGNSPQRPVTQSFDAFFDLEPNKWLSNQWWDWWFETPSSLLWRHCNVHWKCWHCDSHFTRVTESNWKYASRSACNGLVPKRRQAVTWTNDDPVSWRHIMSLCHNALTLSGLVTPNGSTLLHVMFVAWRHQAIIWTNVDLDPCRHMASLGHNELKLFIMGWVEKILELYPLCVTLCFLLKSGLVMWKVMQIQLVMCLPSCILNDDDDDDDDDDNNNDEIKFRYIRLRKLSFTKPEW